MCGICNVVNCIRKSLCGCGRRNYDNSCYCDNSRYREPRTNVICANQHNSCFEPCCDDENTRCRHYQHHHHHDCGCGCND